MRRARYKRSYQRSCHMDSRPRRRADMQQRSRTVEEFQSLWRLFLPEKVTSTIPKTSWISQLGYCGLDTSIYAIRPPQTAHRDTGILPPRIRFLTVNATPRMEHIWWRTRRSRSSNLYSRPTLSKRPKVPTASSASCYGARVGDEPD